MRTLNDYILQACIHSGTSKVFRAYQNSIHREVAVKVYPATYANHPEFIRHFEVNVQFYARLTHPHIVPFYDAWRQPDEAYVVMPLLNSSLASLLNSAHWTPQAIVRLLDQLASALSLLHQHHLVHGNLSAEHVLLDEDHNAYLTGLRVLPHIHELDVHAAHELRLAAHSMAESHAAAVAQADILALARLAQMLLVQSYKRNGRSVPVALGEVLHTATAAEPSHRYATIADFAAALNAALPDRYSVSHQPLVHPLTNRELDVLRLMVEGLANKEIAERLVFSEGTVKWYIQQVYTKLSVHNRQQAIQRALRLGLLADGRLSALSDAGIEGARLSVQDSPCSGQDVRAVENPYKGLRAFEEPDAPDFFGREMLLDQFIAHMASAPGNASPLIVVGPSGCGKSSLIRAGLFPRLRAGALPGSSRWFFAMMTPGSSPFAALAAALLKVAVQPVEDLAALLEAGSHSLPSIIERLLPSGDGALVLFIDQFEEIFTLVEHETLRARFIQTIVEACTDARDRVHVVVALRADFYDRPLAYGSLAALMQTSTRLIAPMTGKELETAITGPAKRVGIAFEVGLVGAILHDLKDQAGALPLLQFTVTELFEQRTGNTLTIEAYRRQGGVSGALVRRAEALFGEMDAASQAALRQAFLRLVTPGDGSGDTRRRAPLAELYSAFQNETVLDDILSAFASRRLLTFDHDPLSRQPVVEVAHEALIREWPRFQQWVEQDRHNLQLARQMRAAVQEWLNAGRDRSFLASGGRLAQFLVLRDSLRLTQDERDYLDASAAHEAQAEAEKQAHRRRI
ncbi:MAG: protein kinase, partial [Anaerolineae bacterium]|nr:protein kinase [Anaerolineae bacterium]